jgi:hypothetical protein
VSTWDGKPRLWQQSLARRSLMGRESTGNPLPAAAYLLGMAPKRTARHTVGHAHRHFKRTRTANPLPAALAVGGLIKSKLGGAVLSKLGIAKDTTNERVQEATAALARAKAGDQKAVGLLFYRIETNHFIDDRHGYAPAVRELIEGGYIDPDTRKIITKRVAVKKEPGILEATLGFAGTKAGQSVLGTVAREVVKGAKRKPARRRRGAYYAAPTGYEEYGVLPPRAPRAPRAPSAPSSASSGPSALAKAGVVIGGLAAGYYIGTQLNKYLAGRALSGEQAGVAAAKAFRQARADAAAAKGAPLSATELRSLGAVYKQQLIALGYDPVTFTRKRGAVESFFTGQEEEEE